MKIYTFNKIKEFIRKFDLKLDEKPKSDIIGFTGIQDEIIVHVDILNFGINNEAIVNFLAFLVFETRIDGLLTYKLLNLNANLTFGGFGIIDNTVVYKYRIMGGKFLTEEKFLNGLISVSNIANDYSKKIIRTHGGVTSLIKAREIFTNNSDSSW